MWSRWRRRSSSQPHSASGAADTTNSISDVHGVAVQAKHIGEVHVHSLGGAEPDNRPSAQPEPDSAFAAPGLGGSGWQSYALVEPQELVHVDAVIADLAHAIATPKAASAITVSGAGGLGKTAITHAAVEEVMAGDHYAHVAWASAKNTRFSTADVSEASVESIYWHELLRMISDQLGCALSPNQALWEEELSDHLMHRMANSRALVVIDNLEVLHSAEHAIGKLRYLGLRRPHKVVVTSRWAVVDDDIDVRDFRIRPLGAVETYDLVRLLAFDSGSDLATAQDRDLSPIFEITEGNPFLIKLITRRFIVTGRPIERIIRELTSASTDNLRDRVRTWLFDQSLNELRTRTSEQDAVALMFAFCAGGRGGSLTYDELRLENGATTPDQFDTLLETACRLGLVRPSDQNRRYSVHSLLYEYTCPLAWREHKE